jgi:NAD-dependent dihydropyrimidine dehydrogenase PreA subunit
MPESKLTVVISAGQSRNPEKRGLEKAVATGASELPGVQVIQIPHLYDLAPKGESFEALRSLDGDLVAMSWLFDRATHWVLDRNGVRGQVGEVLLKDEVDEDETESEEAPVEDRVIESHPRPDRRIYSIDFRVSKDPEEFVSEIRRIAELRKNTQSPPEAGDAGEDSNAESQQASATSVGESPEKLTVEMLQRYAAPTNDTFIGSPANKLSESEQTSTLFGANSLTSIDEHPSRRWYPVIDFSRCTNCMECIDFCLFGVYGVDSLETIVVEQADNCRKGCPACSRVCPQNAIIFPQHKTPAIAGAPVDSGGLKIDLSKLFGAPDNDEDALEVAARERDEQLILAGREAVGMETGLQQRLNSKANQSADDLDGLIDQLDSLDL